MERDIIPMSQKERQRFHLLEMVIGGKTTLKDAGERGVVGSSTPLTKCLVSC